MPDQIANPVNEVRAQYAKVFETLDWVLFKTTADALLEEAVHIKVADMRFEPTNKLLARNSRKRLLIGIGVELLLKATYLKNGFCINKYKDGTPLGFPLKLIQAQKIKLNPADTVTLGNLIDNIHKIIRFQDKVIVLRGLKIAMVFRNKEGHVVTPIHRFDASNYRDIENALVALYGHAFSERLALRFSVAEDEAPIWQVSQITASVRI